jgi:hypothetical protein
MKTACLVAVALLFAPACRFVELHLGRSSHFDFESDSVGAEPIDLVPHGKGWNARVEGGQAASGRRSVRLFAERDLDRNSSGDLSVRLDAVPFRGHVVRVSGTLRVERADAKSSSMRLFVHVERADHRVGLDDAMDEAPLHATEWTPVEIVGAVAADAVTITIGARVTGPGPFHLDDLAIAAVREIGPNDSPHLDRVSERQLSNPDVQVVHLQSALLSRFYGRDIFVDAGVIVPPEQTQGDMAACYQIADFDGSWLRVYTEGAAVAASMRQQYPRMLYVYLDGGAQGHHAFADSVNDGPWGEALVNEIIPAIESRYLAGRAPRCRYVTGNGSGGWSALWLQIAYPHLFNGAWATAPDAVDFRAFHGTDIYTAHALLGGESRLARYPNGPQLTDYESQFSPRGDDGRPMPLCDPRSGAIDPAIAQAWRRFDIGAILNERWGTLGPKLAGRIHVWCSAHDARGRDAAVRLLKQDLERLGAQADVLLVEDRDDENLGDPHPELWPQGMRKLIHCEMAATTAALARP